MARHFHRTTGFYFDHASKVMPRELEQRFVDARARWLRAARDMQEAKAAMDKWHLDFARGFLCVVDGRVHTESERGY